MVRRVVSARMKRVALIAIAVLIATSAHGQVVDKLAAGLSTEMPCFGGQVGARSKVLRELII